MGALSARRDRDPVSFGRHDTFDAAVAGIYRFILAEKMWHTETAQDKRMAEDRGRRQGHDGETMWQQYRRRFQVAVLRSTRKTHKQEPPVPASLGVPASPGKPMGFRDLAGNGGVGNFCQWPNNWLHAALGGLMGDVDMLHISSVTAMESVDGYRGFFRRPPVGSFNVPRSKAVTLRLANFNSEIERHRLLANPGHPRRVSSAHRVRLSV